MATAPAPSNLRLSRCASSAIAPRAGPTSESVCPGARASAATPLGSKSGALGTVAQRRAGVPLFVLFLALASTAGDPIDALPLTGSAPGLRHLPTQMHGDTPDGLVTEHVSNVATNHILHETPDATSAPAGTLALPPFGLVSWTRSRVHMLRPWIHVARVPWEVRTTRWLPDQAKEGDPVRVAFEPGDTVLLYGRTTSGDRRCWIGWQAADGPGFGLGPCPELTDDRWKRVPRQGPGDYRDDREWWVFVPATRAPPAGGWLHLDEHVFNVRPDIPDEPH